MMYLLAVILMVIGFTDPAWAVTRYVDNTLPGTCSSPSDTDYDPTANSGAGACGSGSFSVYNSIAGALAAESSGDVIEIRAGTYLETIADGQIANGTAGAKTIIRKYSNEVVTLRPNASSALAVITVGINSQTNPARTHITFSGLVVDAVNETFGFRVVGGNTSNIIVEDCEIKNAQDSGFLGGSLNAILQRNIVHDNGDTTLDHGIYYSGGNGALITKNKIYSNSGYGIQVYNTATNITITENELYDYGATGLGAIVLTNAHDSIVRKNVIHSPHANANGAGINVYGGNNRVRVENNTLYGGGEGNTGILLNSPGPALPTDTIIKNNIILDFPGAEISNGGTNTTLTTNLTAGTAANIFTDPANDDLTLKAGSAAINAGTAIAGVPANGLPDQGAFETIATPTTAVATGNIVDVTIPMSLNTPVLPATGQTTWVVKFGGIARGTVSAIRKTGSDSVVQITYDGAACQNTDVMTVDFTSGTVSDSALIGNTLNQKLFSFTGLAVDESACTGGGGGSPPTDPVVVYTMNNISGAIVPDTSGNANDGTISGSPSVVTGLIDDALDMADQGSDRLTAPWGSGYNPSEDSATICVLVSPDSTGNRVLAGVPLGSSQRGYISINQATWKIGVQGSGDGAGPNNDFPVSLGWNLACLEFDADTDKATLIVNAVRGTTENAAANASIKPYTSYTFSGNLVVGNGNGFNNNNAMGGVYEHVIIYERVLTQQEHTDLYNSLVTPSPPPPSSTREQKGHKFQRPFKKAGAAEDLRGVDEDGRVSRGGYVDVVIQLDCTDDDCPSFAPRIHRSIDGGTTYAQINDVCGVICFRGESTNTDLVSADAECCLTGALTENDGPTNFTSAAVPNITLVQDSSITLRYKLKVAADATVGQEIYLKVFDQNGNELEGGYTPALGAKLTVKDYANGGGF